jgi:hypothetical protein
MCFKNVFEIVSLKNVVYLSIKLFYQFFLLHVLQSHVKLKGRNFGQNYKLSKFVTRSAKIYQLFIMYLSADKLSYKIQLGTKKTGKFSA